MVDYRSVSISWDPPPSAAFGYQLLVPTANIAMSSIRTRMLTTTLPRGVHTIQVRTHSTHYFSEVRSTTVTVRGEERIRHSTVDYKI